MSRKLLIVDDNAINRQMLRTFRKDCGILEAAGGKEALALIYRHYKMPSAILAGIVMPAADGYARRVRENALFAQIPVIMVTGREDDASRVKAPALGANGFIRKPFNPHIMLHCGKNNSAPKKSASIINALQSDKTTGIRNREYFFGKAGAYVPARLDSDNCNLVNDQYGAVECHRIFQHVNAYPRILSPGKSKIAKPALFPRTRRPICVSASGCTLYGSIRAAQTNVSQSP